MAAKVVVVARTRVSNAPLGEPFRVLTKEAAEKVRLELALPDFFLGFLATQPHTQGFSVW